MPMGEPKKIILIYPPITKLERYCSKIGAAGGEQIPLGIFYVAAYLRSHAWEVQVIDAETEKLTAEQIVSRMRDFGARFIGMSSTTVAFQRAVELASVIKEETPDSMVLLGGPHITSNVNHAMSYEVFDYGVLREGEMTALELLDALVDGLPLDHIRGIAYRDPERKLVVTSSREYIGDLDSLPFPAYDLIPDITRYAPPPSNYKTTPVMNMITTRGCPHQCTFCDNNVFGRKYRERSAENIVMEIKLLFEKYGIREIAFVDDTFLISKQRIYRLFELLDAGHFHFNWTCASRINNVDYEFLKFIKSKGCWAIAFGIESGDEGILKTIKKDISLDRARDVIHWCRTLGIKTKGFFIIGHPTESIETINNTITLACELELDDVLVTFNTPIPGAPQYAEVDKYGILHQADWSQFNYWHPVFVPFGLTQEILFQKHHEFYRRFYLRPRIMWRYFLSFFGKGGFRRLLSILKASRYIIFKE
jgi:anaerobic magnesium-protoporphyrin IX monomethyl ester cyclase